MEISCDHTEGAYHDCGYVEKRNALIPAACRLADRLAGDEPRPARGSAWLSWADRWNREYFAEMDRLARAAGLYR